MMVARIKMFSRTMASVAIFGCALFMGAQPVLAEVSGISKRGDVQIVEQKRVGQVTPGSDHFQSSYEMTKDENKTYRSTYQSEAKERFCCLHLIGRDDSHEI